MSRFSYRPFEILKLIRNGVVTNMRDFMDVLPSGPLHYLREFEVRLTQLGLIEVDDDGSVRTTDRWTDLAGALKLSLSQLSTYDENAVVCLPTFGPPVKPAVDSEAFVLMPFTRDLLPVYEDHIKPVTQELDLTVARADDFFTADSIVRDIWYAINACRIIVADCTGRNPNVFYEIGIAHTLGKPVILIAQTIDDIPFDLRHLRTIVYEFNPRGMQQFEEALRSTLQHELSKAMTLEEAFERYRERNES